MAAIHWFRKGLRLHDNPALLHALEQNVSQLYPVFVLDPHFAKPAYVGVLRYNFLLEALRDLDSSLRAKGSRLYVLKGKPEEIFPRVFQDWKITLLTFESDTEPYAKKRDAAIKNLAAKAKVEVMTAASHTLHDPEAYVRKCGGAEKIPTAYGAFQTLFKKMGSVAAPLDPPSQLPACSDEDKKNQEYDVPALESLGYPAIKPPQKVLFPGGEAQALERLERHLQKPAWIASFEKPKTSPNSLEPSTTVLSPYLKFGCLSARRFYHELKQVYKGFPGHSQPPVSLEGQLLWREFFYLCGHAVPNFDRMENNRICRPIPWKADKNLLNAWENSQTGYPWIDACMAQLRNEGWLHHLARHAVACFLTRGDLLQSWEDGVKVFDKLLLDADWSINNANWMWLSCSSFFYQYFRCYSPVAFGKKTDPKGAFIRKHLPHLAKFPDKFIYEPWKAPIAVQKEAGCIIGKDYPKPIVDHDKVSKEHMTLIGQAYAAYKQQHGGAHADDSGAGSNDGGDDPDHNPAKKAKAGAAPAQRKR